MSKRPVASRSTEHPNKGALARGIAATVKSNRNLGGRPKGVKNKPKGLIPTPLVEDIIRSLAPMLPPGQLRYLHGVIKDGKAIDTRKELDTLILLLNRSIWPALANEAIPYDDPASFTRTISPAEAGSDDTPPVDPPSEPRPSNTYLRKDVTDRLKVLTSLLNMRAGLDKADKGAPDENEQPILKLFAARGIETRIAVLMGDQEVPKQVESGDSEESVS